MEVDGVAEGTPTFIDPQPKRGDPAMRLIAEADTGVAQFPVANDRLRPGDGRIECIAFEDVTEALLDPLQQVGSAMDRHLVAPVMRNLPQVVDAMQMIGMVVRDDHAIYLADVRRIQLLAYVRAAVDQHAGAPGLQKSGRPAALVARVARIAATPIVPEPRHARRRSAAEDTEPHADALVNKR
jgi:hypothetical protein